MQHWHKLGVFSIKVVRCFLSNVRANLGLATTNIHKIQQEGKRKPESAEHTFGGTNSVGVDMGSRGRCCVCLVVFFFLNFLPPL